jgi:hypothetical protein
MCTPLLQYGAHHMANMLIAMIRGQEEGHYCRCCVNASTTSMAEGFEEDPCRRDTPSRCQVFVPGSWSWVAGIGISSSVEKVLD